MERIEEIKARVVYNNRMQRTIEIEINGKYKGIAPSGASKGSSECKELNPKEIVKKFNDEVGKKYIGEKLDFNKIDRELKFLKGKIGGNGCCAFSFALFNGNFILNEKRKYVFPLPLSNVVGGGMHNGRMSIQEILVSPKKAKSFYDAIEKNRSVYLEIKEEMKNKKKFMGYNDESALILDIDDLECLEVVKEISKKYGCVMGCDFAANSYYSQEKKKYKFIGKEMTREEYFEEIKRIIKDFSLKYVEDPFYENDFEMFAQLKKEVKNTLICGDDLTTTNIERVKRAIKKDSINAIIIKPNQIGTLTEAFEVKEECEKKGILPVLSHRSGESVDDTLSKVAIEKGFKLVKFGIGGIRIVKLNSLLELWDRVKKKEMSEVW